MLARLGTLIPREHRPGMARRLLIVLAVALLIGTVNWSMRPSSGPQLQGLDKAMAYSLAISLADTLGMAPGRWKVYASDIDTEVLEKARNGVYRQDELKTAVRFWPEVPEQVRVRKKEKYERHHS